MSDPPSARTRLQVLGLGERCGRSCRERAAPGQTGERHEPELYCQCLRSRASNDRLQVCSTAPQSSKVLPTSRSISPSALPARAPRFERTEPAVLADRCRKWFGVPLPRLEPEHRPTLALLRGRAIARRPERAPQPVLRSHPSRVVHRAERPLGTRKLSPVLCQRQHRMTCYAGLSQSSRIARRCSDVPCALGRKETGSTRRPASLARETLTGTRPCALRASSFEWRMASRSEKSDRSKRARRSASHLVGSVI